MFSLNAATEIFDQATEISDQAPEILNQGIVQINQACFQVAATSVKRALRVHDTDPQGSSKNALLFTKPKCSLPALRMTLSSRLLRIASPCLIAMAGMSTASALDLATFEVFAQGSGLGNVTHAQIIIVDHLVGPGIDPSYRLFESLEFTPDDVGESFVVDSSDPQFELFKQTITNGTDDRFGWGVNFMPGGGGVGFEADESFLFAAGTHYPGPGYFTSIGTLSGPDYAGHTISHIVLTIDSFELVSDGLSYSHDLRATAKIVTLPEPSSAAMMLLGVVAIGARRRSR